MRKMKEKCNEMCVNTALALTTWLCTIALVAPLSSATATINHIPQYTIGKLPIINIIIGCNSLF